MSVRGLQVLEAGSNQLCERQKGALCVQASTALYETVGHQSTTINIKKPTTWKAAGSTANRAPRL